VRLERTITPMQVNQYPKQGSDVLSSMVWADGLVEIPEEKTFKQGEILNFYHNWVSVILIKRSSALHMS
jgi:molybdopterin molybdotransferase